MQELVYKPGTETKVLTPGLTNQQVAVVHFKTGTLSKFGDGGWVAFANDLNSCDIELALDTSPDPASFVPATGGLQTGDIMFRAVIPNLQNTARYRQLQSNTDYYIKVRPQGSDAPGGVSVKIACGAEPGQAPNPVASGHHR